MRLILPLPSVRLTFPCSGDRCPSSVLGVSLQPLTIEDSIKPELAFTLTLEEKEPDF
ncbi:MAG: hypothetical protein HC780_16315 [Leptolyngbyaceae cyanobacterium CSU_1_3]|nr:hypothetical protein [Leptolyngbyaceae cyanobacterium CSU_1_3]